MQTPQVTYYVILPPQRPDVGGSLRPLSRLLQTDEETVRQKLLTPTFEVLSRFAKKPNAEGLQGQLKAFGLTTLLVSDQELRSHLILSAATANKGAGGIAFRDFNDKPLYCPFEDLAGAALLEVACEDGKRALLIDLHRRSTTITPRLDVSLFDFAAMLGKPGSGYDEFLAELEGRSSITVDRRFATHKDHMATVMRGFGTLPSEFPPPPGMILSPYDRNEVRAANIYSFLLQTLMRLG